MPMEDDDLFCTRCGKAVAENKEKAASEKAENPELLADDATITGTMRTVTSETVPDAGRAAGAGGAYGAGMAAGAGAAYGAGMAAGAGAAYGAGPGPAAGSAGSPHRIRPENPAYNRPGADGAAYGRGPAAADAASNAGNPGSDQRPRRKSGSEPGRDSMYGNPHVDTAIEKSKRRGKTDPGRYIMLASAAVLVLVLGFLLFLLVKPVDTDEKKEKDTVAYEDDSKKEENLSQGQQTPASGQAQHSDQSADSGNKETVSPAGADDHSGGDKPADVSPAGSGSQNSGQSAQTPQNNDQSAQTPQNSGQSAQVPQNNDQSAQAPRDSGQSSQPQYEEPEDEGYDDDDGDVSGWEIDEDGNEVYYAGEDEQNTDNVQTTVGGDAGINSNGVEAQSSGKKNTVADKTVSAKNDSDKNVSEKSISDKVEKGDSDYILPESSSRYYTRQELSRLDDYTLQMAINEIYARHGRKFDTQSIREYFEGKAWYRGTINPADFDGNEAAYFNEYELANRELMSQIRAERQGITVR